MTLTPTLGSLIKSLGGNKVIQKVLIANNGIAAVKGIISIRRWAYETLDDEHAVQFAVMATPEDLKANAEYIRMADETHEVPGGANNNNYANVGLIVQLAESIGADAVYAGWGHASENPALPDALAATASEIVFIGPPSGPMRALGDKIGSTIIAQSAGVPCISWNGDGITVTPAQVKEGIPQGVFDEANITTPEAAEAAAVKIGYPVMVKASEGGGGKGIRLVRDPVDMAASYRQVAAEIPGSPIFIMKLAPSARHLEVQLLGDQYGNIIALSGRDCSVQRRHQKIVEEGPPSAAAPDVWVEMERAAVRLARAVGYMNVGTVEYLYTGDGKFAFLELNPRLQVEHPVTEMITQVNLPACQLLVACGVPLHRIADVRRVYGEDMSGDSTIDFYDPARRVVPQGHVVACRITAENPESGFTPTSGAIQELNFQPSRHVWGYFSVDSSGRVHEFADSQIGHLFSWGETRESARKSMALALKTVQIRGDIHTTTEFLVELMETPDFINSTIDTAWLDKRIAAQVQSSNKPDPLRFVLVAALCLVHDACSRRTAEYVAQLERGQFPPPGLLQLSSEESLILGGVKYVLQCRRVGPMLYSLSCNGSSVVGEVKQVRSDGGLVVSLGRHTHTAYVLKEVAGMRLRLDRHSCLFTEEYDPTVLRAAMAGKLSRYLVPNGAHLNRGDSFAELEAMKMYMNLRVSESCTVTHARAEGTVVDAGDVLATAVLDDPSKVKLSKLFKSVIPEMESGRRATHLPHLHLREALSVIDDVMSGFAPLSTAATEKALETLNIASLDPRTPFLEFREVVSALAGRIPEPLMKHFKELEAQYVMDNLWVTAQRGGTSVNARATRVSPASAGSSKFLEGVVGAGGSESKEGRGNAADIRSNSSCAVAGTAGADSSSSYAGIEGDVDEFPAAQLLPLLNDYTRKLPQRERRLFSDSMVAVRELAQRFEHGVAGAAVGTMLHVVDRFVDLETQFALPDVVASAASSSHTTASEPPQLLRSSSTSSGTRAERNADAINRLRLAHKAELGHVFGAALSHAGLHQKLPVVMALMRRAAEVARQVEEDRLLCQQMSNRDDEAPDDGSGSFLISAVTQTLLKVQALPLREYAEISLEARNLLLALNKPSVHLQRREVGSSLRAIVRTGERQGERWAAMQSLIGQSEVVFDSLLQLLDKPLRVSGLHPPLPAAALQRAAVEVYARAVYRAYLLRSVQVTDLEGLPLAHMMWQHNEEEAVPIGIRTKDSFDDLMSLATAEAAPFASSCSAGGDVRETVMGCVRGLQGVISSLPKLLNTFQQRQPRLRQGVTPPPPRNALHLLVLSPELMPVAAAAEDAASDQLSVDTQGSESETSLNSSTRRKATLPMVSPRHARMAQGSGDLGSLMASSVGRQRRESNQRPGEFKLVKHLHRFLNSQVTALAGADVRRVTVTVIGGTEVLVASEAGELTKRASIYTFRHSLRWCEDPIVRHLEPPLAYHLDLDRLAAFAIQLVLTTTNAVHVYEASPKAEPEASGRSATKRKKRFFVRVLVRDIGALALGGGGGSAGESGLSGITDGGIRALDAHPGPERSFVDALDALEMALAEETKHGGSALGNHIFLNVIPDAVVDARYCRQVIQVLEHRYRHRIAALGIQEVEFKINARFHEGAPVVPIRLIATNPTGQVMRIDAYAEARDPHTKRTIFTAIDARGGDSGVGVNAGLGGSTGGMTALPAGRVGELDGQEVSVPYPIINPFDLKRARALLLSDTLYVYDFLDLFERALENIWAKYCRTHESEGLRPPRTLMRAVELVLPPEEVARARAAGGTSAAAQLPAEPVLEEVAREAGQNDIGMVAWRITLFTPEFPEEEGGRDMVLIANDITHLAGSFGTAEDALFHAATLYASGRGIPRVYIAANSGARIGVCEQLKQCFDVAWRDSEHPSKGYDYLYLQREHYLRLGGQPARLAVAAADRGASTGIEEGRKESLPPAATAASKEVEDEPAVVASRVVTSEGEERWKIDYIVGAANDLGVENLRGSGTIAGDTARAYNNIFTLTYVAGRSVGIGAYLVRLGQRTLQKRSGAPIILTGFSALNSLMGRDVYSSNDQLGGVNIMYNNGTSHGVVDTDLEGVAAILKWLSYVPAVRGGRLPVTLLADDEVLDRDVEVEATGGGTRDPRDLLTGIPDTAAVAASAASKGGATRKPGEAQQQDADSWLGGLFDRGSWSETLAGWAKTVVTGRARLGGIPVGVVVTETRTVEHTTPADPAAPESGEQVIMQAGQVWYPDSAYKTAQAIRDFHGEGLPLMIIANWRGFSGGQRDMFNEVLKFGAYIVDALVAYTHPVFVYVPPHGELRGGAWVVVDPTINAEVMEMYAAPESRGGVLEPSGAVTIKFRRHHQVATAHRLDPQLRRLDAQLKVAEVSLAEAAAAGESGIAQAADLETVALRSAVLEREQEVVSTYQQVATVFSDLHDKPGRMRAKGVINGVVPWPTARVFFYLRLRRRLWEFELRQQVAKLQRCSLLEAAEVLRGWYLAWTVRQDKRSIRSGGRRQTRGSVTAAASAATSRVPGEEEDPWRDDERVWIWMSDPNSTLARELQALEPASVSAQVSELATQNPLAAAHGVLSFLNDPTLDPLVKEQMVATLRRGVIFVNQSPGAFSRRVQY